MPDATLLTLRGIGKRFGGVIALDGVDFELRAGEIHALLGENGAGKSTLIKILGGIHRPDSGEILLDGRAVTIQEVTDADSLGIRLIHQELSLAPNLSVAENIFLGREPGRFGFLDRRQLFTNAQAVIAELGLPEIGAVEARVADLSVAQQQMVEIARALSTRARILILDEPTASLSEAETEALFGKLRGLASQGVGIIYISHRLEEIQRLAHRITVLRDGRSVGTQAAAELNQSELIRLMVGRDLQAHYPRPPRKPGGVALTVRNLRNAQVRDVSFELRYGEILGFAGLVGAGRTELARALFGIDPLHGGEILVDGKAATIRCPSDALTAGLALVPEDRKRQGLVMTGSVAYNLALPWTHEWISGCVPNLQRRNGIVSRTVQRFRIRISDPEQPIGSLSGGNQQKVVVGKWMERPPRILILDEPTRGVDVGAREEMFAILHQMVEQGMAVILISSDLPEVMNLSHRLALYRDGRIVREVAAQEITPEEVMAELTRN
ncbi:MAG: sugar ABC transporter ATP-binding protein [Verrucomicrobiota bacterium]